jgi:glycine/D-amino acid oxidase-like deaminating enzyme
LSDLGSFFALKVRSSSPFWPLRDGIVSNYPALRENLACEVAIVGGGLSGAMTGYALSRAGVDTVVLDKRDIAMGSTSASTALVMYEVDLMMKDLSKLRGEKFAADSYRKCFESTKKIEKLVKELGRDCGFRKKDNLYLAKHKGDLHSLEEECVMRRKHGYEVELLNQSEIERHFSFSSPGALLTRDSAELDPYLLTHFLLDRAKKRNLQAFDRTRVKKFGRTDRGVVLTTGEGFTIRAKKLVYATGYESPAYVKRVVKLKSTYAISSEPLENIEGWGYNQCLIWELASPYLYLRTTDDGRMIVGGGDEDFVNPVKRDQLIGSKASELLRKVKKMFPKIDLEIAYSWAGTFGETKDSLPYIGEVKKFPNSYFALCYGANGTNFAQIGAETIRDLYLGVLSPEDNIFGFGRR